MKGRPWNSNSNSTSALALAVLKSLQTKKQAIYNTKHPSINQRMKHFRHKMALGRKANKKHYKIILKSVKCVKSQ